MLHSALLSLSRESEKAPTTCHAKGLLADAHSWTPRPSCLTNPVAVEPRSIFTECSLGIESFALESAHCTPEPQARTCDDQVF